MRNWLWKAKPECQMSKTNWPLADGSAENLSVKILLRTTKSDYLYGVSLIRL